MTGLPPPCAPGSPPRARGAGHVSRPSGMGGKITPACAGSSGPRSGPARGHWITPACTGSRAFRPHSYRRTGDHPRVRGEKGGHHDGHQGGHGSPPRARGAADRRRRRGAVVGITPACAGSRGCGCGAGSRCADHPRVRGEQPSVRWKSSGYRGSPPRARGAGARRVRVGRRARITPACAGSSSGYVKAGCVNQDHPRVRGEQGSPSAIRAVNSGSPPRARGAEPHRVARAVPGGITPACAGSRSGRYGTGARTWDHPRVRGEQALAPPVEGCPQGSPPRARGAGYPGCTCTGSGRITPACAGSR